MTASNQGHSISYVVDGQPPREPLQWDIDLSLVNDVAGLFY